MKERSLTWRLVSTVVIAELLCAIVLCAAALVHEHHERYHALDVLLRGRADSLMGSLQDAEDAGDNLLVNRADFSAPSEDAYFAEEAGGRVVGESRSWARDFKVPDHDGYSEQTVDGKAYRLLRARGVRLIDADDSGGIQRNVVLVYATPLSGVWHGIFEAVRFYVAATLLLLVVTAVGLAWYVRRVLLPLRTLASQAAAVTTDSWNFTPSDAVMQTRELRPLAVSMVNLLRGLEREFLERRRFVSDAAHELKTELAVIKSSLQLLTLKRKGSEADVAGLHRPLQDVEQMEALVSRMLVLGRLEERGAEMEAQTDLAGVVKQSAEQLRALADVRQVRVVCTLASSRATVGLSSDDASTLCSNLITNALQHSAAGAIVDITVAESENSVRLMIADRGEGIPPEALPHVFDRFFRADKSRARQTGGSGLGLAICQAIVDRAGGRIELESEVGAGTTVTVILPLSNGGRAEVNDQLR